MSALSQPWLHWLIECGISGSSDQILGIDRHRPP